MRILFLIRALSVGGAERQLVLLAGALKVRGHDVAVMTYYPDGDLARELAATGVRQISLGKKGRWHVFSFVLRLIGSIRHYKPEVILSYLALANVMAVAVKPFIAKCRIIWGIRDAKLPLEHYDWMRRLELRLEALVSGFADHTIANSEAGRTAAMERGFARDKVSVVYNGIDTHRFRICDEDRKRVRAELGLEDGNIAVGTVGRLTPQKDYWTFLKTAAALHARNPEMRFLCIGGGQSAYEKKLRTISEELGLKHVLQWLGPRNDMPALYNAMDVMCLSSLDEGFSNAIAEAMASGVPCAVTDVGDSALIVDDPDLVAPCKDPERLAAAVEHAWRTRNLKLARRNRITTMYNVKNLVQQTEALLHEDDYPIQPTSAIARTHAPDEFRPVDILFWLWRRKWFLLASTFGAALIAAAISFVPARGYQAEAILRPILTQDSEGGGGGAGGILGQFAGSVLGGSNIASSSTVTLSYMQSMEFLGSFIQKENLLPDLYPARWDIKRKTWKGDPPQMEMAIDKLKDALSVAQMENGLVKTDVVWRTPEKALWILNRLISEINARRQRLALEKASANLEYLENRLQHEPVQEMRVTIAGLAARELTRIMLAQKPGEYALEIVNPPYASDIPVSPQRKLITLIGAIVGFMIGALSLLIRDAFRGA
jgi:glycosyltransferase involved in cell wall biosynthesis